MNSDLRATAAIHEAGQAVASWALNRRVRKVSIEPDSDSLGHVLHYSMGVRPESVVDGRTRLGACQPF